jgi:nucleoredoxin
MRSLRHAFLALLALSSLLPLAAAGLPEEITVTAPAKLELMRGDKVSGTVGLRVGEKLQLIDVAGDYALVRYRNLNGRVALAQTDLPASAALAPLPPPPAPAPTPAPAAAAPPVATPHRVLPMLAQPPPELPADPAVEHTPANPLERALAGKLVKLENGALRPFDGARLAGVKFYAIYFSAGWCAPCRAFTPGFVDAYKKIRELYPEFEVVLVNEDHSAAEMLAYMRDDHMAWPALRWEESKSTHEITRLAGAGIPCLVLVDENGKVLSDSFRWSGYVGADTVLDDTWKILRDYRRKHPRAQL